MVSRPRLPLAPVLRAGALPLRAALALLAATISASDSTSPSCSRSDSPCASVDEPPSAPSSSLGVTMRTFFFWRRVRLVVGVDSPLRERVGVRRLSDSVSVSRSDVPCPSCEVMLARRFLAEWPERREDDGVDERGGMTTSGWSENEPEGLRAGLDEEGRRWRPVLERKVVQARSSSLEFGSCERFGISFAPCRHLE